MSKITKSQLIKLQVLQAVQKLVKGGLYRASVFVQTKKSNVTLSIQVYCKDGVWTPYMEDYESVGTGVYIGHCEGDTEIVKELDNYTLASFTVYHG